MNIGILLPKYYRKPGGGCKMVLEYANFMANKGHNVTIYVMPNSFLHKIKMPLMLRCAALNLYLKCSKKFPWFELNRTVKAKAIIDKNKIATEDVVIATSVETSIFLEDLEKINFIQDFEVWKHTEHEVYKTYNNCLGNIVVSNWLKSIVDSHTSKASFLVSNGIDTGIFKPGNIKRKKHSIVFQYRSAEFKGCKYAIEVIRKLENIYDDLMVDVISNEENPDNLPNSCKFYHAISSKFVVEINNTNQVFMCTTIDEGFGLPGLEAMACGCAVVSTAYTGVYEYAVDGVNALLSPVKDVDAMVNNIVKLFEEDDFREMIANNGIKTGKEKSLQKSAEEFEWILHLLTSEKKVGKY